MCSPEGHTCCFPVPLAKWTPKYSGDEKGTVTWAAMEQQAWFPIENGRNPLFRTGKPPQNTNTEFWLLPFLFSFLPSSFSFLFFFYSSIHSFKTFIWCLISCRRHLDLVIHLDFWRRVFLLPSFILFFLLGATLWWFPSFIFLYVDLNYNIPFHIFQAETHTWFDVVLQTAQLKHWCLVLSVSAESWFNALWLEDDLYQLFYHLRPLSPLSVDRTAVFTHPKSHPCLPSGEHSGNLPCLSASRLLLQAVCVCTCSVARSNPTLCDPMECSPPGSSVHGISQARILERTAFSYSKGSSWPRYWIHVSCIGKRILYHWATREALD